MVQDKHFELPPPQKKRWVVNHIFKVFNMIYWAWYQCSTAHYTFKNKLNVKLI